ncbi:MAG: HAMP domain-containing histidine kinase [Phycisphaerae bacterium]|nr:HAMP domain-containing histidine kinase [Phycisphaerae bacterium]
MHIGVRRKFLVGYATAIVVGTVVVCAFWPTAILPVLVLLAYCLMAGWAVASISNWWLHRSISRLRRAADAIGRGHLSERVEVHPGDELGKLAGAFNQMANRLEDTVAEERILQDQLMRSEKLAVIGELAAEVAHEVNNPLDGVQNCSRLLRRSLDDPRRVRQILDLMDTGLYRIEMIIRRLLTQARSDPPVITQVRLDEVAQDAVLFLEPKIARREIEFVREVHDKPVHVRADRQQITQVLVNLILNAIDSMPEGGRLTVRVRQPDPELGMGCFQVCDTGCGIPEHKHKDIFEPFFTTKEPGTGTGLGLSVVARIVEAHEGKIEVSSTPGQGTTFTVFLPLTEGAGQAVAAAEVGLASVTQNGLRHDGAG